MNRLEMTDEELFYAFWRWVKVHHPEVRMQFLQDFVVGGEEL
jgi:hypothetical protein